MFIYPFAFAFFSAFSAFFIVSTIPIWYAVAITLFTSHPAKRLVEHSSASKRPDQMVEATLAGILRNYHTSDAREVDRLLNELSPIRRWKWQIRARKHQREAERLEAIVSNQASKMRADAGLARGVHDREHARRGR